MSHNASPASGTNGAATAASNSFPENDTVYRNASEPANGAASATSDTTAPAPAPRTAHATGTAPELANNALHPHESEFLMESDVPLDRRIAKSREALRCAFISLLQEQGFDAVTVNDLCATAGINRTTFYNHFKDKDQLLSYFEQDVLKRLEAFQPRIASLGVAELFACSLTKRPPRALIDLFALLGSEGDLLHALLGDGGDPAFARALNEVVCVNIVRSVLHKKYREHPSVFVEYYISFYATAYLGVITRWILTGRRESAEEMARICMRLLFIRPGESIRL